MPHVATWKKEEVSDLKEMIDSHEVVGIANLADIPAPQLQKMRHNLRGQAQVKMSRKTLMNLALNNSSKKDISGLSEHMEGQPALIFTDMNPFKLFKILENSKTPAPARAGSIATADIVVPKGDTSFAPGPILGELQKIGIPAKIEKGKIVITDDKTIVSEGEEISRDVASMLTRLDIYPMEVGIDLKAAYEQQTIYTSDLLTIDETKTLSDINKAVTRAMNLSINALIFTRESTPAIIQNAALKALNLAMNAEIMTSKTGEMLLSKAYSQMMALASALSEKDSAVLDDDLLQRLNSQAVIIETTSDKEEPSKPDEEEEEEDEEEKEEEAAAGLGALFG